MSTTPNKQESRPIDASNFPPGWGWYTINLDRLLNNYPRYVQNGDPDYIPTLTSQAHGGIRY